MRSSHSRYWLIAAGVLCALGAFVASGHVLRAQPGSSAPVVQSLAPDHLQTASMSDPVGVDRPVPNLSWELRATSPNAHRLLQVSYQILAASTAEELARNRGDMWDSGRVKSGQRLFIPYAGRPLASHHTYFWKVRVWDQAGNASVWSAPAKWTTAILHPEEWTAHWIAAEPDGPLQPQVLEGRPMVAESVQPLPLFRKDFHVTGPIKSAFVFVSGLGQYELHLNGHNVTDTVLNPGWTDYRKEALYNSFDVTKLLHAGDNAFGVMLGNGMYHVPAVRDRYSKWIGSFGQPKLILQMHIAYQDGTEATVTSDASWRTAPGPITFSSIYGGEDYDARRLREGWDLPGFHEGADWRPALNVADPDGTTGPVGAGLSGLHIPPMVVADRLKPVRTTQPTPNVTVYDMGRNSSGWPEIVVRGHAGDRVRMLPGELLQPDGRVTQKNVGGGPKNPVLFEYTLAGGEEHWHPRFSYYGFRYVEVESIPAIAGGAAPEVVSLETDFLHDDAAVDGQFASGVKLLEDIHALIDRAILSNMASVLTDCPTREKLGWLEQTHLAGYSIMANYGMLSLYEKMANDMAEAQLPDGLVPGIAPEYVAFVDAQGRSTKFRDSPEWGSAVVLSPWQAYKFYGDAAILRDHYDSMVRYAAYLRGKLQDGMLGYGLGDWYDIGPRAPGESQLTGKGLTATATYYQDLDTLAEIANVLGKEADAAAFRKEATQIRESFNRHLLHAETAIYDRGSQTAQAMPLALGLVPAELRQSVLDNLVKDIHAHGDHVTAGDIGFHYVVRALTESGRSDVLFDMLTRDDSPSYGYQLKRGATTLTEAWDTEGASQDHFMLGHAEEWFYRGLAGIDIDMSRPEARQIMLRPAFLAKVPSARATIHTVLGSVESSWSRHGPEVVWEIRIPAGSVATIGLPEQASKVSIRDGPTPHSRGGEFQLASGQYELRFDLP